MLSTDRLSVVAFLLFLGLVLQIFSLRVDDFGSNDDSLTVYKASVQRERLHQTSVVLVLCSLVTLGVLST